MRLFVVIPVAVLTACAVGIGLVVPSGYAAWAERRRAEAEPRTGMDILNAYTCGRGETKRIIVRGVEDSFSPAGDEPGYIRPGRNHASSLPRTGTGEYDQVNADQAFTDSFKVDGRIANGMFLIRTRKLNDSNNDNLVLGNLSVDPESGAAGRRGDNMLPFPEREGAGIQHEVIYFTDIDQIAFQDDPTVSDGPAHNLKSYLNDPAGPGWLDVFVNDDTAVDFMGLALCLAPTVARGTTLMPHRLDGPELEGVIILTCHNTPNREDLCNPYVGDKACSATLPVACLRPGDAPAPTDARGNAVFTNWSGADIAITEPVSADRFRSARDVEAFCAGRFGPGWRVANLNDGYRFQGMSGLGDPGTVTGPVWVDVVGQPYATCWKRE